MSSKKNLITTAFLAISSLAAVSTAQAATATGTFDVKLTITSFCSVASTTGNQDINFGTYVANTAIVDIAEQSSANDISVTCSKNTPYIVNLTPSNNDTSGAGVMTGPDSATIGYQLTQTAGGSAWSNTGNLTDDGNGVSGIGNGLAIAADSYKVYATVTSTTDVEPGVYSDTVAVSVTY